MYTENSPQYILLPQNGVKAKSTREQELLSSLPSAKSTSSPLHSKLAFNLDEEVLVIDSTSEDGPKLVQIESVTANKINSTNLPIRAVEVVKYKHPKPNVAILNYDKDRGAGALRSITMKVINKVTRAGVPGMKIIAFTDSKSRSGDSGVTNHLGQVHLQLRGREIEKLFGYPPNGYWGAYRINFSIKKNIEITIEPVSLNFTDCVRSYYPNTQFNDQTGVIVGVIDTGVGPHSDLNILGGRNTVTGERPNNFDDWDAHGTHVAGLIGASGTPSIGLRGMAPNIFLRAYRVFGNKSGSATNYAILKAMIFAAADQCDIINLSLGGGPPDRIVQEAIQDARENGMLVIVAAGNDNRGAVNYPAGYNGAIGVSAMGVRNTFPTGSLEEAEILFPPTGNNPQEFLAAFTNIGLGVDMVGLGVGALSTLPKDQFGPMSGTSMAAPVVAGAAACLLSNDLSIYNLQRDRHRSQRIEKLVLSNGSKRGFGLIYEGFGLPDPNVI